MLINASMCLDSKKNREDIIRTDPHLPEATKSLHTPPKDESDDPVSVSEVKITRFVCP